MTQSTSTQELAEALAALRASREREVLLRNELSFRMRNMLAITRSIFARTMATATTLEHANDHFRGRLDAMARYHGRSTALPTPDFDLEAMVSDELLTFAVADDPRVEISGGEQLLHHEAAELLGLTLHELTTNSVKFGVLANMEGAGRLRIAWTVEDHSLDFTWEETGIAIVSPAPIPHGFGRELIEEVLPYQLGANTGFAIVPGGLRVHIRFKLDQAGNKRDLST